MKKLLSIALLFPLLSIAQKKQITLDDIYKTGTFRAESVPGFQSMNDGKYYMEAYSNGILKKLFVTGETVDTILKAQDVKDESLSQIPINDIEWNTDEKKVLIFTDKESIYRRSNKSIVYSYNLETKKTMKVDDEKILHPTYSPDGCKVAFVKNNNLYLKDLLSNKTTQISNDGEWNKVINGNCDWVYEEEFGFTKAFQWSKNGNYIAYYKFNESKVPEYSMTMFKDLYPNEYSYKYPKAGEVNSIIEIHIFNVANGKDILADIGTETDIYIPRIKWTEDDTKLGIAWLNRLQNHLKWLSADANTGATNTIYDETNKCYVEVEDELKFLKDGKHFITCSEKDGFKQLYLFKLDGTQVAQLTTGNYDIDAIQGINENAKTIYYTAAYPTPMERQLFQVSYVGKKTAPKLLTKGPGLHKINMNNDYSYFVDNYSTINKPPIIAIYDIQGKLIKTLKDNQKLINKMNEYAIGNVELIQIPNTKGDTLNGWMLKPADFDSSKKYPVLFCNYGGPGSQQVADKWGAVTFWHQYLSQNGYIVACVDNTGTGFRGEAFKKKTYLQLGKYEIEDQIDAAKYLGTLPYVDKSRIGHWGWSYGGFMSSLAITKGADVYKMAIAVAPVTNWRYYDNIYTERFMRTPQENAKGYDENSPLNFTKKIKGKFLILHGTGDDNVHFQNSVMMVEKMIQNNIDFESGYYPNKAHGISGGNTTYHIYKKMTDFIFKNL